jgi:hypothetical protein
MPKYRARSLDRGGRPGHISISNTQLQQMEHGTFAIADSSGNVLVLTELGEKIAVLY